MNLFNSVQLGASHTISQSYIRVRVVVWVCGCGQTHTDARDHNTFRVVYAYESLYYSLLNTNTNFANPLQFSYLLMHAYFRLSAWVPNRGQLVGVAGGWDFFAVKTAKSALKYLSFYSGSFPNYSVRPHPD